MKQQKDKGFKFTRFTSRPRRERGMATLLATTLLLVVSILGALAVSRAAFFEQKIAGSDLRNKEVYASAISGLDYAVRWMLDGDEVWDDGAAAPDDLADTQQGVDEYEHELSYTLLTPAGVVPAVVEVTSTATATGDTQVTKTVKVKVIKSSLLTPSIITGPPLLVEDCADGVVGTPDIHPGDGLSIGTVTGTESCIHPGFFDAFDDNGDPITVAVGEVADAGVDLHDTVFGPLRESDVQRLAQLFPTAFFYVHSGNADTYLSGGNWHMSVGSDSTDASGNYNDQVVIYFDSSVNCPRFNGGVVIYGLVYYEQADCELHGGGAADVYGTVAVSGDLTKFNANTDLIKRNLDSFSGDDSPYELISVVPGSFIDY